MQALSYGERLASLIVAQAFRHVGVRAAQVLRKSPGPAPQITRDAAPLPPRADSLRNNEAETERPPSRLRIELARQPPGIPCACCAVAPAGAILKWDNEF